MNECAVCRQLRDEGPDPREFSVAPDRGGGWDQWSAALLRFIARMGHLTGDSRLSIDEEALLAELGWLSPTWSEDDPDEMAANWKLPLIRGDWLYLIEMLLATMVGVLGFSSQLPIQVRSFGCRHPCRDCSWPDELLKQAH